LRAGLVSSGWMNTFNPYVVGTSCILQGGDRADHRMTELNVLIASAAASGRARSVERLHRTSFGFRDPHRLPPFLTTAVDLTSADNNRARRKGLCPGNRRREI
jgi:hypothetical protein